MTRSKRINRVAVIGAGPTGLAAAKYLLAEDYFERVDVFEKRSSVGGVWNYSAAVLKQRLATPVPQLDPNHPVEQPVWQTRGSGEGSQGSSEPVFISPIYSTLDTNIPKELMAYGEKTFPANAQVLPKHSTVKEYLEEYAEEIRELMQFETEVLNVEKRGSEMGTWSITTRNIRTGTEQTGSYDAVVAASGHFDVPYLPDMSGIKHWNETYPGTISHSKLYDAPEEFRGKKVLVVGSSASAIDIGNQINAFSKGQLLISQRTQSYLLPSAASNKLYFPEIVEFLPPDRYTRAVRFANGNIETDIDSIVFCTGYLYSFPYVSSLNPPVIVDGRRVLNTYQHLFYIYDTTLVFPVLPQRVIPFPLSENQAAVFARVWSGRLFLPPVPEMKAWEDATALEKGHGTSFHLMPFPLDANYMNLLHEWAAQAEKRQGLINDGQGKNSNYWGVKEKWMRELFPEIRRTFVDKGEERRSITSLTQLGYDFDTSEGQ